MHPIVILSTKNSENFGNGCE